MKTRLLVIALLAVGGMALYCGLMRPEVSAIPAKLRDPIDELKPLPIPLPEPPPLVVSAPTIPPPDLPLRSINLPLHRPEVPIQDKATIDFSTGSPHVKSQGKDQKALDDALKEIADVTKEVSIAPRKD